MRSVALLLIICAAAAAARADEPSAADYEARIRALEERVKKLEALPAPSPPQQSAPAPAQPPKLQPLDVREPPFGEFDFSWMNGTNRQPASLLVTGPLTWSIYVDAYYGWQFWAPVDHTVFPSTTAPRHNEIGFNLATLGVEINLDGPIGRIYLQYGSNVETDAGQDATVNRGFFLTDKAFQFIQQAAGGWHFHWLHGVNLEMGIFPSYVALESYLPQENWNYTHALLSDSTPYYFFGIRGQLYLTQRLKLELWLVNGWQTFGQWHEGRAGGYLINWRPREWVSLTTAAYFGQDAMTDSGSLRSYFDSYAQLRYYRGRGKRSIRSAAICLVFDGGYERRTNARSGAVIGASLTHRVEWLPQLATTARLDIYYDQTQALIPKLPINSPYLLPFPNSEFLGGGFTLTNDYLPSPWLVLRLEYAHRESNLPYFSGPGGITGPNGVAPANPALFTPDLRKHDDRLLFNVTLRL
jgi:hypothetical protein